MNIKKLKAIDANVIKLLAAVLMLIDHIGFILLPQVGVLRDIGRISMPLFAFMVAEGCRYTRNKVKHFLLIFLLGVACQIVYFLFDGRLYMSILITFSLSVIMIYALQYCKKCLLSRDENIFTKILSLLAFAATVYLTWVLNGIENINGKEFVIDYGFWGCMLPVFAAVLDFRNIPLPEKLKWLDNYYLKFALFAVGIVLLALQPSALNEWYALIALVPLAFYSGETGRFKLKYFFYVFYPLHLVLLQAIAMLL